MSRITLIGGSGLLGTALCRLLTDIGHNVLVLDLVRPDPSVSERVTFRRCDIRCRRDLEQLEPCDRAYLLAALLSKRCMEDPLDGWATNVTGVANVIDAILGLPAAPTVCFLSSAAVYRASDGASTIAESAPTHPNGLYGASKLFGEGLLRSAGHVFGLRSYVLRPFTAYGPGPASGHKGHFVASWIEQCVARRSLVVHGDGSQSVDLVHTSDIAELCRRADEAEIASPEAPCLNVGSGVETKIAEVVGWFQHVDPTVRVEHHQGIRPVQMRNVADIALARKTLGYEPRISPREGVVELLTSRLAIRT